MFGCRRHGNGAAFPDWQRATGAHECVKIEVAAYKLDLGSVVPSIHVRGPSLNVGHAFGQLDDAWTVAGRPRQRSECRTSPSLAPPCRDGRTEIR